MSKIYKLSAKVTISVYTEVEAETEEEALEIAKERQNGELAINSGYSEDEFWVAEELDGEPFDVRINL